VKTKAQARELQEALALKARRQRDGLEPMPTDRAFTVGALLRWWLNTYVAGKSWARPAWLSAVRMRLPSWRAICLCLRCKRNGSPHEEKHANCERRRCPKCNMLLWAKALPRKFRLHDTRHTTATLLLAAGLDLYAVARILRHSDPKVTFETYAHLVPGYLHEQIDRLPKLDGFAALVLQDLAKHLKSRPTSTRRKPQKTAM
jgi:hypothetical protein